MSSFVYSRYGQSYGGTPGIYDPNEAYPSLLAKVSPTADPTGRGDFDRLGDALYRAGVAGGGLIEYAPGNYFSGLLSSSETRQMVSGTALYCPKPFGAVWTNYSDPNSFNSSNQLSVIDADNCVIDGFDFNGNRTAANIAAGGLPSSDAVGNGIRVVRANNFTLKNTQLRSQIYHGLIGVQSLDNALIQNVRGVLNGYRSIHIHSESGQQYRRLIVDNVHSLYNGQYTSHGWTGTAYGASGQKVVQLSAGAGATFAIMFAIVGAGNIFFVMRGAGVGGGDLIDTVSSVNSGADQITLANNIGTTVVVGNPAPAQALGEVNSGLFVAYGGDDLQLTNIHCFGEMGWGMQLAGSVDTLATSVFQGNGSIVATNLNKLYLSATDYLTFRNAYNALSAGNKLVTTVNLDGVTSAFGEYKSTIVSFNDGDSSVTLTTAASYPLTGVRVTSSYTVNSAGTYTYAATGNVIENISINNCMLGLGILNLSDMSASNLKISNSMIYGAWIQTGNNIAFDSNCSIVKSGVQALRIQAFADSNNIVWDGHISSSGASGVDMQNSATKKLTGVKIGPNALVEYSGLNSHFRQGSNYLGSINFVGINAHNDPGTGLCEGPYIKGEVARNWGGALRLTATVGGQSFGAKLYDNVDPAAVDNGSAVGKGASAIKALSNALKYEVIACDFRHRDRINESLTIDLSNASQTGWRVLFNNLLGEDRAGNLGNAMTVAADTEHYGNTVTATMTVAGGGVTTIPAI